MNCSVLSPSSIFQEISLFPFSKIVGTYLQNISRDAFLFCLRIGIVYHEENFLMTGTSRIERDQENMEDAVERPNQIITAFLLQPMRFYIVVMKKCETSSAISFALLSFLK